MTKEKQIEEMSQIMHDGCAIVRGTNQCRGEDCLDCAAVTCYEKGYRKASEVAEEIFEEISKASVNWGCYCITTSKAGFLTEDVNRTLTELKKKYTESEKSSEK